MGTPNSDWVNRFVNGKTIKYLMQDPSGQIIIKFNEGESLSIIPIIRKINHKSDVKVIVTPLQASGEIKQTVDI